MRLPPPFNKPNNYDKDRTMMMTMIVPMPNPMVPSSTSSLMSSSVSSSDFVTPSSLESPICTTTGRTTGTIPIVHPEDTNLYCIPSELSPKYKSLPFRLRMVLGIISTYIFASRSFVLRGTFELLKTSSQIGLVWWWPIRFIRILLSYSTWAKRHVFLDVIKVCIKSYILYTISTIFVQDVILPKRYSPSRISTAELLSKYSTLPSTYSNYNRLITNDTTSNVQYQYKQNIHYLKAIRNQRTIDNTSVTSTGTTMSMDVIYVNHGFGASSLSWLPTIPTLLPHTKVLFGHDAPGFGFTDRWQQYNHSSSPQEVPSPSYYYSITNSATIGTTLIQNVIPAEKNEGNTNTNVLLLGHSLGSLTTLRMALQQQNDTTKQQHIVLVSPAVGFRTTTNKTKKNDDDEDTTLLLQPITTTTTATLLPTQKKPILAPIGRRDGVLPLFVRRPLQRIGTSVACYGLKRLVGQTNFWRNGLQQFVWNTKNKNLKLRDSDVLRYQWPAIISDWEIGLVQFASEQVTSASRGSENDELMTDVELIQTVLNLPNVHSIHVIVGSNDRVIPNGHIVNFFRQHFQHQINVTVMDGFGHNPFEQDPELFVQTLQSIVASHR